MPLSDIVLKELANQCKNNTAQNAVKAIQDIFLQTNNADCERFIQELIKLVDLEKIKLITSAIFHMELETKDATTALRDCSLAKFLFAYIAEISFASQLMAYFNAYNVNKIDYETALGTKLTEQQEELDWMMQQFTFLITRYPATDSIEKRRTNAAHAFLFNILQTIYIKHFPDVQPESDINQAPALQSQRLLRSEYLVSLVIWLLSGKQGDQPKTLCQKIADTYLKLVINIKEMNYEAAAITVEQFRQYIIEHIQNRKSPGTSALLTQSLGLHRIPLLEDHAIESFACSLNLVQIEDEAKHEELLKNLKECWLVAADNGNFLLLQIFLYWGIDIHLADSRDANQAIHRTAKFNHTFILLWLLTKRGLRTDLRNHHGELPIHLAASNGAGGSLRILLSHNKGADIEKTNTLQQTVLFCAVANNQWLNIKEILPYNPVMQIQDATKRTLLHCAVESGLVDVIRLIMKAEPDITLVDRENRTAVDVARDVCKRSDLAFLILDLRDEAARSKRLQATDKLSQQLEAVRQKNNHLKEELKKSDRYSPAKLIALINSKKQPNNSDSAVTFRWYAAVLLHEYVFSFERTKDTQFALKVIAAHNKSLDEININQIFLDFNACLIKTLPDRSLSGTCREFDYLLNVQSKTHAEILTNIFQQAGMTLVSSPNVIPKEGNKLAL